MLHALMLLAAQGGGDCPKMELGMIGEHMTGAGLIVTFDPEPKGPLTYDWTISGTRILEGQGTRSLSTEAELSDLISRDHFLTGSVTIGGLPADCPAVYPFTIPMPRFDPLPDRAVTEALRADCPAKRIETASDKIGMFSHRLVIDPMPGNPLTYRWQVSEGTILQGQGTPAIVHKIDVARLHGKIVNYTAIVTVGGLPEGCPPTVILRTQIGPL